MADSLPELPQDIIDNILRRLPARSIGRFRSVSKPWLSHLSSYKFMKSHRDFHIRKGARKTIIPAAQYSHFLTFPANGSGRSEKVISPVKSWIAELSTTCHGFALLSDDGRNLIVFNPITLEALEIPADPIQRELGSKSRSHKYKRNLGLGLGYDSYSDDYKIVSLYDSDRGLDQGTNVYVFSLKTLAWSAASHSPLNHNHECIPNPAAYSNGRLHWIALDGERVVISAFNLERDEFEQLPIPPLTEYGDGFEAATFGQHLALVCGDVNASKLWVMKEYGVPESWTKLVIDSRGIDRGNYLCLYGEDQIVFRKLPWVNDEYEPGWVDEEYEFECTDTEQFSVYSLSYGVWYDFSKAGIGTISEKRGVVGKTFTDCLLSPRSFYTPRKRGREGLGSDVDDKGTKTNN